MTKQQLTARVAELETIAAPVLDEDFCDIVVSAVRYALPRHSYMPSLTRDYVWKHWPLLAKKHWCILRDIREHYHDTINIYADYKHLMDVDDLNAWVSFYNQLIQREDTHLPGRQEQRSAEPAAAQLKTTQRSSWWSFEPRVGRVAHGVASRVDRLKALGNGQVPLVAATAFQILKQRLDNIQP